MPAIPGAENITPGVVTSVETQSTGSAVPGGVRIAAIIGEGARDEVIAGSALGGGKDGLNPTYTSANGSDGRHFILKNVPVVSNRTQLFKNGFPLIGLEAQIDTNAFSNMYDYRIDISNGHIEMQTAHLVDQGGSFFTSGGTNVGKGSIQNLTLTDINAPTETWTIKCVSVQRNNMSQPIAATARFVAFGSISGNVLDANGNPVVWIANNQVATNSILRFSILETSPVLREGDFFTIKVKSGALNRNDSLTATYIAVGDLNDPTFFTKMADITTKHGHVSINNVLSLGSQIAFANGPPGVMCLQSAPSMPRRTSYELVESFDADSTNVDDFVIPLTFGVVPNLESNIHVFITNPTTGVETQLLPNKFPFYSLDTSGKPTTSDFVFDDVNPPGGNSFSYSVNQQIATLNFAIDGYMNRFLDSQIDGYFSSATVTTFDSTYINKQVVIFDATNAANNGTFDVVGVNGGTLHLQATASPPFADYINETSISFRLIDPIFGLPVASSDGTDGALVAVGSSATGHFTSSAVDFSAFDPMGAGLKLQVVSATNAENVGLFDITAYSSGPNQLTIAKSFVSEHDLKFEAQDPDLTSDYLVLNHNVVPDGNRLRITIVDEKDATFFDAGWETALAALETQELDIVVPLPKQTISVIFENTANHCITMSNARNRKERVAFIGTINGLTPDNLTGAKDAAVEDIGILEGIQGETVADVLAGNTEDLANYSVSNAYGDTFRVVYFFPDQIVVQVGTDNQILDGFYLAAAGAGYLSGVPNIAIPLTNKVLSGFSILRSRQFSPLTYQNLAAAGVTSLQPVAGGGSVVWGLTTTQSGFPEEQEISIVFIRDRIAKSLRQGFAGFIGQPESQNTIPTLSARALALLNSFVAQGLITDFANLNISRDLSEPRQWNISLAVQPVYPINWIYIKVGIGRL